VSVAVHSDSSLLWIDSQYWKRYVVQPVGSVTVQASMTMFVAPSEANLAIEEPSSGRYELVAAMITPGDATQGRRTSLERGVAKKLGGGARRHGKGVCRGPDWCCTTDYPSGDLRRSCGDLRVAAGQPARCRRPGAPTLRMPER
jgi:hypothetical protein